MSQLTRTSIPLLLALLVAFPCCAAGREPPPQASAVSAPQAAGPTTPSSGELAAASRALRITVDTAITVDKLDPAINAVRESVARHGGFIGEARTSGTEEARYATFELHIPVPDLAGFRSDMAKLGEISSDAEKSEDVTEQRADIKARLANARAGERRLLDLMEKNTGSLADVLAVEKELGQIRETIERMEAQERVLEGQIASATVHLTLRTRWSDVPPQASSRIARAARDGVSAAGTFLLGVVLLAAYSGPTLLILVAAGYLAYRLGRWWWRRSKAKKMALSAKTYGA